MENKKNIFEKALNHMKIYDDSKTFIVDDNVEEVVKSIKEILSKEAPYSDIPKLPDLSERFIDAYMNVIKNIEGPIFDSIAEAKDRVFGELETKPYKDELKEGFTKLFMELKDKATTCNNVATLKNIKIEADALKIRLLNEIDRKDMRIADTVEIDYSGDKDTKPQTKKRKNVSIKNVSKNSSWQIESLEDLDEYISDLREQIMKEINEDTIISIEL